MKMCDSSSDIESIEETLLDIRDATAHGPNQINENTKKTYDKYYQDLMDWMNTNKKQSFHEKVLLEYFIEKSHKYKSSSLITMFSSLKKTLSEKHNVYISRYSAVIAFLKRKYKSYTGKKFKTFSPEHIYKFLREAPDNEYLCTKVVLVFGVVGGCSRLQLYKLQFKDIEDLGTKFLIKVKNTKTRVDRIFTVTGDYYELCKKYTSLRPDPCTSTKLFLQYKSGKCFSQSIGLNHFGQLAKSVAKFLKLSNPELYSGYCFKKMSAGMFVDTDGDKLPFRRHRYKSKQASETDSCVKDSIQSSLENKSIENNPALQSGKKTSTLEDCSNNTIENIIQGIQCTDSLDKKNIEYVNVDVPILNISESLDESTESKDDTWSQIKLSFSNENDVSNTNTPSRSVIEDYIDDSMDEDQARNQNPLEDNPDKVININIPNTVNDLQQALGTLVRFDNCSIQNVKINH